VHMDADRYTFHPELPGLAFMGMWDQAGGYFVPLELQARWIAYSWGGAIPAISATDQRSAIDAYRSNRGTPQKTRMDLAALTFARAAGVEPIWTAGRSCAGHCCSVPWRQAVFGSRARMPCPTRRNGSRAMQPASARSHQTT
jgi:hypothetical protein